jgi:hypothetical protein
MPLAWTFRTECFQGDEAVRALASFRDSRKLVPSGHVPCQAKPTADQYPSG